MKTPLLAVFSLLLPAGPAAGAGLRSASGDDAPCACAPRRYALRLALTRRCDADDLVGGEGVGGTLCMFLQSDGGDVRGDDVSAEQLSASVITGVQFLEFGPADDLTVINQDDSHANVTLRDGDAVTFDSIAMKLDPALSLEEQPEHVPGGVQVTVRTRLPEGTSVTQLLSWSYTRNCGVLSLTGGERLGWLTFVSVLLRSALSSFPLCALSS